MITTRPLSPWEWDLKRLATSFTVATRDRLDKQGRTELAAIVARAYRETMAALAETPILDAWYRALTVDDEDRAAAMGIDARSLRKAGSVLAHAVEIASLSHHPGPAPRIKDEPPSCTTLRPLLHLPFRPQSKQCWTTTVPR